MRSVPRHAGGIFRHAGFKALVRGPVVISQSGPVNQASPTGSGRFVLSGYMGASERAPQMRGLKMGSMRVSSGRTAYEAASARLKKRPKRRKPSSIRSIDVAYESRR